MNKRIMLIAFLSLLSIGFAETDMGGFAVEDTRESHDLGNIRSLYQQGQYEKVIVFFDQFQKDYPRSPNMAEAKFYLGVALMKLGDFKQSLDVLLGIVTASEGNLPDQIFEAIGICYLNLGDYPHAEEWLIKAESSTTDAAAVASALGDLYMSTGELDKAETYLKRAVAQNAGLVEAQNNLGLLYMRQKKYEDAKDHFLQVLKTGKKLDVAYYNLGLIGMVENDYYSAANNFKLLVTLAPNAAENHVLLGRALEGERKYDDALAEADAALKIDPNHKGALALKDSVTKKKQK